MNKLVSSTLVICLLSSCALSPQAFQCQADAGLGCRRVDEVNAWVEQGVFDAHDTQKNQLRVWHAGIPHELKITG